jgi:hypothetical protein
MPESPRTRHRGRPRAATVTGDGGRLTGPPTERPGPPPAGTLPPLPAELVDIHTRKRLAAEETARHKLKWSRGRPPSFKAWCSCGNWTVSWPTVRRQTTARAHHSGHVAEHVRRNLQEHLGLLYHTTRGGRRRKGAQ